MVFLDSIVAGNPKPSRVAAIGNCGRKQDDAPCGSTSVETGSDIW
jgi:hypothetical protein